MGTMHEALAYSLPESLKSLAKRSQSSIHHNKLVIYFQALKLVSSTHFTTADSSYIITTESKRHNISQHVISQNLIIHDKKSCVHKYLTIAQNKTKKKHVICYILLQQPNTIINKPKQFNEIIIIRPFCLILFVLIVLSVLSL